MINKYIRYFTFSSIILLLAISCNKAGVEDKTETQSGCPAPPYPANENVEFVPGQVLVSIKNEAGIEITFELFNQCEDLLIDEMTSFSYSSTYPADSANALRDFLNAKPYIGEKNTSAVVKPDAQTGMLDVTMSFYEMNTTNQQDWIQTKAELQLIDRQDSYPKWVILKVPVGQEAYWIKKFNASELVNYAEYNGIVHP